MNIRAIKKEPGKNPRIVFITEDAEVINHEIDCKSYDIVNLKNYELEKSIGQLSLMLDPTGFVKGKQKNFDIGNKEKPTAIFGTVLFVRIALQGYLTSISDKDIDVIDKYLNGDYKYDLVEFLMKGGNL